MKNVKGFAVASDGDMKRIAVTYDEIDDVTRKAINVNQKRNYATDDSEVLAAVSKIELYVKELLSLE